MWVFLSFNPEPGQVLCDLFVRLGDILQNILPNKAIHEQISLGFSQNFKAMLELFDKSNEMLKIYKTGKKNQKFLIDISWIMEENIENELFLLENSTNIQAIVNSLERILSSLEKKQQSDIQEILQFLLAKSLSVIQCHPEKILLDKIFLIIGKCNGLIIVQSSPELNRSPLKAKIESSPNNYSEVNKQENFNGKNKEHEVVKTQTEFKIQESLGKSRENEIRRNVNENNRQEFSPRRASEIIKKSIGVNANEASPTKMKANEIKISVKPYTDDIIDIPKPSSFESTNYQKGLLKDAPKDIPKNIPKEVPKDAPKDTPKVISTDIPINSPKDALIDKSIDAQNNPPQDSPMPKKIKLKVTAKNYSDDDLNPPTSIESKAWKEKSDKEIQTIVKDLFLKYKHQWEQTSDLNIHEVSKALKAMGFYNTFNNDIYIVIQSMILEENEGNHKMFWDKILKACEAVLTPEEINKIKAESRSNRIDSVEKYNSPNEKKCDKVEYHGKYKIKYANKKQEESENHEKIEEIKIQDDIHEDSQGNGVHN